MRLMLGFALGASGFSPSSLTNYVDTRMVSNVDYRSATDIIMVLRLPQPPSFLVPATAPSGNERLREDDVWVDYRMERVGLTKRHVSGGIIVEADTSAIWAVLTAFEELPKVVPNILSNSVTRRPDGTMGPFHRWLLLACALESHCIFSQTALACVRT